MPGRMKSVTMGASKAIAIRQMNDVEKMIAEGVVAYWEARKPEREAMEKQRTEEGERKMQEQLTALTKNVQETDLPKQVKEPSSDEEGLKNACNSLVDCRSGRGEKMRMWARPPHPLIARNDCVLKGEEISDTLEEDIIELIYPIDMR